MATTNPFDLLGDDDNDDPSQLIAKLPLATAKKSPAAPAQGAAAQPAKPPAKFPGKPLPPAQAVRETRSDGQRGGRGGERGTGRGRGFYRDSANNENTYGSSNGNSGGYRPPEDGDGDKPSERRVYGGPRPGFRGGRRGGFSSGEAADGERPRRAFERRSGTGRGNEFKREGAGLGNWGTPNDEIAPETEEPTIESEKTVDAEKQVGQEDVGNANKENPVNEPEEKPEAKEMTLEEYEKVLEEKRKTLLPQKAEERKVGLDKDFASMQLLSSKKSDEDIFVKLGSEKDKRKEAAEKEERAKKSLSINEFLKPADGEKYNGPRGQGRGRNPRGAYGGGSGANRANGGGNRGSYMTDELPSIKDDSHFPSLGGK